MSDGYEATALFLRQRVLILQARLAEAIECCTIKDNHNLWLEIRLKKIMARCADLLDEDQFNELDALARATDSAPAAWEDMSAEMKWYSYPGNCPPDIPGQLDSRCLCWIETPDGMAYIGLRAFRFVDGDFGWFSGNHRESGHVTHWMPLPEPPWVVGSHDLRKDDLPFVRRSKP